ncbi:alpha/beta hydrolase [Gulosibacter chungangensis]|uniref:Alpha/beta hydrolase n=1 Tax=Gulosibacter chungangensis TaxID=979746 RepID=A0A7J5B7C1_9MICO|nr:alpha/beta hydrolase [Gulosibacter chungangensis]KAB1640814.1 alpha/beta hydrolase [Gulosibacter chungangensis]
MQIPLSRVAADQRPLIAAFRDAGGKSFQDAGSVERSRVNYETSCAANGLAPDAVASVEDVAVGAFGVRVYDPRPAGASAADPVIVFAHGGGWVIGSLETHDSVCRRLATLTGLPVVAIDYRLGPEVPFPAGHEDCRDAVAWVREVATDRSWDASRILTVGDSAGGGIATALAFEPRMQVPGTRVIGQVLLYPMLDVANESPGFERITEGVPLTADTIRWFVENYVPDAALRLDHRVSPLLAVRGEEPDASPQPSAPVQRSAAVQPSAALQPPAWILSLGLDPLADEALEYARLLALGGTEVELVHLPDHAHGLFSSAGKVRTGELMLERAAEFILRTVAASR